MAIHGGDESEYSILNMYELFERTVDYLDSNFSDYTFAGASYDHSLATSAWELSSDNDLVETYVESLKKHSITADMVKLALKLITSDTGVSRANLYPMLFVGNESKSIPLGSPLKI